MSPTSPLIVNDAAALSPLTARCRPATLVSMNEQSTLAQPHGRPNGEHGNAPAGSLQTIFAKRPARPARPTLSRPARRCMVLLHGVKSQVSRYWQLP